MDRKTHAQTNTMYRKRELITVHHSSINPLAPVNSSLSWFRNLTCEFFVTRMDGIITRMTDGHVMKNGRIMKALAPYAVVTALVASPSHSFVD